MKRLTEASYEYLGCDEYKLHYFIRRYYHDEVIVVKEAEYLLDNGDILHCLGITPDLKDKEFSSTVMISTVLSQLE